MKQLAILISGRGSNMVRIARCCQDEKWPAQVCGVISNRPDADGLSAASDLGLPTRIVDHRQFSSRGQFDAELARQIDNLGADLVILAGFMRILGDAFVHRYHRRLVNIHPSLLPAFPGLDTHQRALEAGVKAHGATVHFVVPALDAGPVIGQAVVPVMAGDTAQTLARRVQAAEHHLYPAAIRWLIHDQVELAGDRTELHAPGSACLMFPEPDSG